ncbi:MAG: ABC transporter substrate-binding protein, partial [Candidatus Heimdallarchaeaceae archaeon]
MRKKGKIVPVMFICLFIFQVSFSQKTNAASAIANLVLRTNGGGVRPDYALFIAQDLRNIGIEVEIRVEEWTVFLGALLETHDYDMAVVGMYGGDGPDMRDVYTEEKEMNIFGLDKSIPYCNQSEQMQDEGVTITDPAARQQHYYEWQQLMMDKIIPMLPLFYPQRFECIWSNIMGYEAESGLRDSLPYMESDGYHQEQTSLTELNIADATHNIHAMDVCDCTSISKIWDVISEPLFQYHELGMPVKTGIVDDWEQIDEFHYKFYMRDNIYWNPSYNITERTDSSVPLEYVVSTALMKGLKDNEYSNGTNQQVTSKDAVFSILLAANQITVNSAGSFDWISKVFPDSADPLAFHILVDGDPVTLEEEIYVDLWSNLNFDLYPEFFMNSSDSYISYTQGGAKTVGLYPGIRNSLHWSNFELSPFGCGKYMIDYIDQQSEALLHKSPYWFGIGSFDGTLQDLGFETIRVHMLRELKEIISLFKLGRLDWTNMLTSFPAERRQMQDDSRFDVQSVIQKSMVMLAFNLQRPFIGGADNYIFLDTIGKEEYTLGVARRKAMCYAIDRDAINRYIHNFDHIVAHNVVSPYLSYYYYNDVIKYNYDLYAS